MNSPSSRRDQTLNQLIAAYLNALEHGRQPDRDELLNQHPDLAVANHVVRPSGC